ncbi:MAG: hypothetical protein WC670_18375 [Pseudolabrys sp.]|jgi:hypothetical protein
MGVKELREAFNSVASPRFSANVALMDYSRAHDTEWQILTFSGTAADGSAFTIKSDPLRAETDLPEASRVTAGRLLQQGNLRT